MADFNQQPEGEQQEDLSAIVSDVFGLTDSGSGAAAEGSPPAANNEPSVGTEGGAAAAEVQPIPAAAPSPTPEGGSGSAAPVQPTAPAAPEGQQAPTPPATPTADPNVLEIQSLKAQIEALKSAVTAQTTPDAGQSGAGQQDGAGQIQVEPINVQLPQPILEAIYDEDPAKAAAGLNSLVSLISTGLNHRFRTQLAATEQRFAAQLQTLQQSGTAVSEQETAKQQRDDYFNAFPQHNKPVFLPILQQEAAQLIAQYPGVAWDENFRNTLGARVNAKLQEAGVNIGPGDPAATQSPATPPKPAAMLPTGARPAPDDDSNLIADTFSF